MLSVNDDQPEAVLPLYLCASSPRQAGHFLDNLSSYVLVRQQRPAALPTRFGESQIQRIEFDARELFLLELAFGDHLLPVVGIGGMADSVVLIADVGEVGRPRIAAKTVA